MDSPMKPKTSISTRLTVMVAGILVIAVSLVGGVAVRQQEQQARRALETKATTMAQFMAEVTPLGVLSLNFVEMKNVVRKVVVTDEEAVYAVIVNEQWIPLAHFFRGAAQAPSGPARDPMDVKDLQATLEAIRRTGRVLEVSAPIVAGDRHIGSVLLGLSFDNVRRAALVQIATIVAIVVAIIASSILLLRIILRRILMPAEALTAAAIQISAGKLDVAVTGTQRDDELGVLSRAFESMADQLRGLVGGLELRVRERTAELEAANSELEAFAYSVSHDLRAPLRHIDGFVELLRKRTTESADEQTRHYMDTISKETRRMGQLIDDLLSFSRMGRAEMSRGPVELGPLVNEVVAELAPEGAGRDLRWRIGPMPAVSGDRALLRVVFSNLIGNAMKFTRSRSSAEIEVGCRGEISGETVLFVRDNGVGFDPTYTAKLFGVFQRLHRPEEFEGIGIGLATVRRIVARHGGRTWAEGEVGQGATFSFSLPLPSPGDRDARRLLVLPERDGLEAAARG
jgi:signal transduction histidine kinase